MDCSPELLFSTAISAGYSSLKPLLPSATITCITASLPSSGPYAGFHGRSRKALTLHFMKAPVGPDQSLLCNVSLSLHCSLRDGKESVPSDRQPLGAVSGNGRSCFSGLPAGEGVGFAASQDTRLSSDATVVEDRMPGGNGRSCFSGLPEGESVRFAASRDTRLASDMIVVEDRMPGGDSIADNDLRAGNGGIRQRKKRKVIGLLLEGNSPIEVLKSLPGWGAVEFWTVIKHLAAENRFGEALQVFAWWRGQENYVPCEKHFVAFIKMLGIAKRPDISQLIFDEMKALGLQAGLESYTALLNSYAEAGCIDEAEALAQKLPEFGIRPNATSFHGLMLAYMKQGNLDKMNRLFNNMKRWGYSPEHQTYKCMIVAYAKAGLFRHMERVQREMDNNGWKLDFSIINAILQGYAAHNHVNDMHTSYLRIQDYRVLVSKVTVRTMASLYIRTSKFYLMRVFVKDLGLSRKEFGNLLWNLLLVAFAASFQVKNLQRSCLGMEMAGFAFNLSTYNICVLCYARMKMMWELHALLIRMRKAGVVADLVTFGAVVDTCIIGRERYQKMFMELDQLQLKELCPAVNTDPLVLQAFGKGDFHSCSETLMQANPQPYGKSWTYGLLLSFYLKKRGAKRNLQNFCDRQGSRFVAKKFFIKRMDEQDAAH